MKIKTSKVTDLQLNWLVTSIEYPSQLYDFFPMYGKGDLHYSTDWSQGGPIIDQEEITIDYRDNETQARKWSDEINDYIEARAGKKQGLIAAMRCYVASKLGDEVDIPEELL